MCRGGEEGASFSSFSSFSSLPVILYYIISSFSSFCSSFSLLLLESGEIYFEDYAAVYLLPKEKPASAESWEEKFEGGIIRGRLKVRLEEFEGSLREEG